MAGFRLLLYDDEKVNYVILITDKIGISGRIMCSRAVLRWFLRDHSSSIRIDLGSKD